VYEIINDLRHEDKMITPSAIAMRFRDKNEVSTLIELFDYRINDMVSHLDNGYAANTIGYYKTAKSKVIEFLKEHYSSADIELNKLDFDFLQKFDSFLSVKYKNKINTIDKYVKRLKAAVNTAINLKKLKENPFMNYKSKNEQSNRQSLNKEEIETIEKLDLQGNERLLLSRDLFLFMSYTGISYSDMKDLTKDNLTLSISGNTLLNFNRNKTNTKCNVPLFPKAKEILNKYKYHSVCQYKGCPLPVITNQCLK